MPLEHPKMLGMNGAAKEPWAELASAPLSLVLAVTPFTPRMWLLRSPCSWLLTWSKLHLGVNWDKMKYRERRGGLRALRGVINSEWGFLWLVEWQHQLLLCPVMWAEKRSLRSSEVQEHPEHLSLTIPCTNVSPLTCARWAVEHRRGAVQNFWVTR